MIEQEFRILDVLSREIGNPISIRQLAAKILDIYGSGDYKNIYAAIKEMERKKTVILEQSGKSSIARLNFGNYLITDLLAEMELKKKHDFLKEKQEMQMLMLEINTYFHNLFLIKSISLMKPERNTKLNTAELLINIKTSEDKSSELTKIDIHNLIDTLQKIHNIRIDYLVLEDKMLHDLLKSNESNPIREVLHDKITILHPQDFWITIRDAIEKGTMIIVEQNEINPAKIAEHDLVFNLARFGYTEFGPKIKEGQLICIEYIVTAILFQNDARRIDAIPIIIAKNSRKINYNLLIFLARKYHFEGRILGILQALKSLVAHGMKAVDKAIRLLETMKVKEIKADKRNMKEKLRLYNVT